jgi:hypothetical protein
MRTLRGIVCAGASDAKHISQKWSPSRSMDWKEFGGRRRAVYRDELVEDAHCA